VFVPGNPFQLSLMLVGKAWANLKGARVRYLQSLETNKIFKNFAHTILHREKYNMEKDSGKT
jgi:hypothetical protein